MVIYSQDHGGQGHHCVYKLELTEFKLCRDRNHQDTDQSSNSIGQFTMEKLFEILFKSETVSANYL